jgi:hypothetical protein
MARRASRAGWFSFFLTFGQGVLGVFVGHGLAGTDLA